MEKCTNCKFCVLQDDGYSNYTVMGTTFTCLKGAHPSSGEDMWGLDMGVATNCSSYTFGQAIELDVDGEVEYKESDLDSEVWNLYKDF